MNSTLNCLLATMCGYFYAAGTLFAQNYTNYCPAIDIVPYGGTYTYSVSWDFSDLPPNWGAFVFESFNAPGAGITFSDIVLNPGTYTYTINGVTTTDDGAYSVTVEDDTSPAVYLYVSPAILRQPENTACVVGSSTTLGIAAGPSGSIFQWFDAATDIAVNSANSSPSLTAATTNDSQLVYCRIVNNYGQVISSNALLTVGVAPTITTQPSNVSVVTGNSATFNVTADGSAPMYYQWCQNGFAIQGANLSYITLLQVTNTDIQTFSVVISNAFGQTTSAVATLITGSAPQALSASLENDSSVNLQTIGTPGATYVLQVTTNLMSSNWQSVVTNSADTNGVWSFIDANTLLCPTKFYRVTIP
jgi:hypothetical protein